MIIDVIKENIDINIVTHKTSLNENLITIINSNDIYNWKMEDVEVDKIDLIFTFKKLSYFKSVNYNIISKTLPKCSIYHSLDGNNWQDFKYISFNMSSNIYTNDSLTINDNTYTPNIVNECLNKFKNKLFKMIIFNTELIINSDIVPVHKLLVFTEKITNQETEIINHVLSQEYFNKDTIININYEHKNINEYLYNTLQTNFLKITLEKFEISDVIPLVFSSLSIEIDEIIDNMKIQVSPFIDNLFKQKYNYDNPFLRNITKTYFDMLEETSVIK